MVAGRATFHSPDLKRLEKIFARVFPKQVAFATAKALTRTAQDIQAKQRQEMPRRFTRKPGRGPITPRVIKGIAIRRAEAKDWPRTQAVVGSKDQFMVQQETGGVKKARGSHRLGIPSKRIKLTPGGKTRRRDKPREILTRKSARRVEHSGGRGSIRGRSKNLLQELTAKGNRKSKSVENVVFWWLKKKVKLKPRLGLRKTAASHGRLVYGRHFRREFRQALRTMK